MFRKHLIARGLLTEQHRFQALEQQGSLRMSELEFCARAVELGVPTPTQRDALLAAQAETRLPLGQEVALMGVVPADTVEAELDAYNEAKPAAEES